MPLMSEPDRRMKLRGCPQLISPTATLRIADNRCVSTQGDKQKEVEVGYETQLLKAKKVFI